MTTATSENAAGQAAASNPATAAPAQLAAAQTQPATGEASKPAEVQAKEAGTILGASPEAGKEGNPSGESAKQTAPEKYTDFTLPEGMTIDKAALEKATPTFKELNLSQEQAQKLVTLQSELTNAQLTKIQDNFNSKVNEWKLESEKLFGAKANEEFAIAVKAIDRFGGQELRKLMDESGLGNHPEIIKAFNKIGKMLSEGQPPSGEKGAVEGDPLAKMYPTMKGK